MTPTVPNYPQKNNTPNLQKILILVGGAIIILLLIVITYLIATRPTTAVETEKDQTEKAEDSIKTDTTKSEQNDNVESISDSNDKEVNTHQKEQRIAMVINDADGWTNIRSAMSSNASIVDKVYEGTVFYITYTNNSKWCKFYWNETGPSAGYIYKKYIKPVGSTKTPPNQQKVNSSKGKYHIIIGSYHNYNDAYNICYNNPNDLFDLEVVYNSSVNAYRISAYSSYSKADVKNMLETAKYYYPDAWISKE